MRAFVRNEAASDYYRANIRRCPPKRTDPPNGEPRKGTVAYRTRTNIDFLYGKQRGDCVGCGNHYISTSIVFDGDTHPLEPLVQQAVQQKYISAAIEALRGGRRRPVLSRTAS